MALVNGKFRVGSREESGQLDFSTAGRSWERTTARLAGLCLVFVLGGCDHADSQNATSSPDVMETASELADATPTPMARPRGITGVEGPASGSPVLPEGTANRCYAFYETGFEAPPDWGRWRRGHGSQEQGNGNSNEFIDAPRHPLIGVYDSRDRGVIGYHLLAMKGAGFDGAVLAWHGQGNAPMMAIDRFFELARNWDEHHGISFNLMLQVDAADYAGIAARERPFALARDMDQLLERYGGSPVYQQLEGAPVVAFRPRPDPHRPNQPSFSRAEIVQARNQVRRAFKLAYLDAGPELTGVVDLPFASIPRGVSDDGGQYLDWFYTGIAARKARGEAISMVMGAVYPGVEDRISGNSIPRTVEGQSTLIRTWQHVQAFNRRNPEAGIRWVQTVSWNDWPNGSEIEPSIERETIDYERAADLNRQFSGIENFPLDALSVARTYLNAYHAKRAVPNFTRALDLFGAGDTVGAHQALR